MHGSFFLNQYIRRDLVINEILDSLNSDNPQENAFKLTGIRGAGKTVTLTAIDRRTMNLIEIKLPRFREFVQNSISEINH